METFDYMAGAVSFDWHDRWAAAYQLQQQLRQDPECAADVLYVVEDAVALLEAMRDQECAQNQWRCTEAARFHW